MAPEQRPDVHIALVGFGNANRAFAEVLLERLGPLPFCPRATAVLTGRSGTLVAGRGSSIDLVAALKAEKIRDLEGARSGGLSPEETIDLLLRLRSEGRLDVVVEAIPTDHTTGEPALSFTRAALRAGVSVVSANKAPVAIALPSLLELAGRSGCRYLHESACMDGIPIFNLARRCLPFARVSGFEGVLNGTTNVMLEHLEKDPSLSFDAALKVAQDMGIAEADPSGDIDGFDAALKCVCLARALGLDPEAELGKVKPLEGIRGLDGKAVAEKLPKRYKLVCRGQRKEDGTCQLSVSRELVDPSSPLHSVSGASSCVTLFTDVLGALTLVQGDPTTRDTGYGLFADLCEASESLLAKKTRCGGEEEGGEEGGAAPAQAAKRSRRGGEEVGEKEKEREKGMGR